MPCAVIAIVYMLTSCASSPKQKGLVYINDFESMKGWVPTLNLTKFPAHSGIFAAKLDSSHTFGPALKLKFEDVSPLSVRKVKFSMWVYRKSSSAEGKVVVAVDAGSHLNLLWEAKHIQELAPIAGKWSEIKGEFNLIKDNANSPANIINIYPWNTSKEEIDVDDIRIEFVL